MIKNKTTVKFYGFNLKMEVPQSEDKSNADSGGQGTTRERTNEGDTTPKTPAKKQEEHSTAH